jgi:hypothetical protein
MYADNKRILGEWADQGYFLKAYPDHTVTVCYKDDGIDELAAFEQTLATPEMLQKVCQHHHARLAELVEAAQ